MREREALLDVVVRDEEEGAVHGEDRGFFVPGAVFKREEGVCGDLAAMRHLHAVSPRYDAAIFTAQREKAMYGSGDMANRHGLRRGARVKSGGQ